MTAPPVRCDIYRTDLPMRAFEHAAARRRRARAVVLRIELGNGHAGWGEALPREYVTGETADSVITDLREELWPALVASWPGVPPGRPPRESAERISAAVPQRDVEGRRTNAAACALELAALEAARVFPSGGRIEPRVSGVLGSSDPDRTAKRLRLMRLYGLRHFKLKLGLDEACDEENLRLVAGGLGGALRSGECTLRADINGAWTAGQTPERIVRLREVGICAVEQPTFCPAGELAELAARCELPLIADESLVTEQDAQTLAAAGGKVWWNIRLSKNGGFVPALAMARMAAEREIRFVVGCMVGESGILSLWQRRLLQAGARPRFVEGNYGKLLLKADLVRPSPRFRYGGRLTEAPPRPCRVKRRALKRYAEHVATLRA